ncbi:CHAT domain-containing protein [Fulvivirgaceae bacterium BMA12]|uniref:CHAT domain-containing protein n=1 Tax=Agaribacillus aureus TaxID=3051825 RepID=A0ABT8LCA2_9BACT|nr:CHAT domain-containing protein [Fulvivirgaceae bacterium BMA12]
MRPKNHKTLTGFLCFFMLVFNNFLSLAGEVEKTSDLLWPAQNKDSLQAESLRQKALRLHEERQVDSATFYFRQSMALFKAVNSWKGHIVTKQNLANHYLKAGKVDSSKVMLFEALRLLEKHQPGDTSTLIRINFNLVEIYNRRTEKLDSAILMGERNAALIKKFKSPKQATDLLNTYNFLGVCYRDLGFLQIGDNYLDSALHVLNTNTVKNQDLMRSMVYHNKGTIMGFKGNLKEGLFYYTESQKILKEVVPATSPYLTQPLTGIGNLLIDLNESEADNLKAIAYFREGVDILEKGGNAKHYFLPYLYYGFMRAFINLEAYDSALFYVEKAEAVNVALYGEQYGEKGYVLNGKGLIYLKMGDLENAEVMANTALEFLGKELGKKHKFNGKGLKILGEVYQKRGDFDKALSYYQQCLAIHSTNFTPRDVFSLPSYDSLNFNMDLVRVLQSKADILSQLYMENDDERYLQGAIASYDLINDFIKLSRKGFYANYSKINFTEKTDTIYKNGVHLITTLVNASGNKDYLVNALRLADNHKSSILLENLEDNGARVFSNIPNSIKLKEFSLKSEIANLQKELYDTNDKTTEQTGEIRQKLLESVETFNQLKRKIESLYPNYHTFKYKSKPFSLTEVTGKDELLMEYFLLTDSIYIFFLDQGKVDYLSVKREPHLERDVEQLLAAIKSKDFQGFVDKSHHLYRQIFEPVEAYLAAKASSIDELIIIPDGILSYLPFEVLIRHPASNDGNYLTLEYMIKDYQISYHYSIQLLKHGPDKSKKDHQNTFVGFAPEFMSNEAFQVLAVNDVERSYLESSAALPQAREEVQFIATLLDGVANIGQNATEYNFKNLAKNSRIIHLASHSLVNDEDPMYSKLLFSTGNDSIEDGLLHTYELFNMELNADLACLSACNTGIGKYYKGEGIISLARGFMEAGVPNLMMSLWSVSDQSTKDLMTSFYQGITQGEKNVTALRNAKLKYLSESDNLSAAPYYWAPFVYIGKTNGADTTTPSAYYLLGALALVVLGAVIYKKRGGNEKQPDH